MRISYSKFTLAARHGLISSLGLICFTDKNCYKTEDDGTTALWHAASNGHVNVVRFLLGLVEEGEPAVPGTTVAPEPIQQQAKVSLNQSAKNDTPLMVAARKDQARVVECLLANGLSTPVDAFNALCISPNLSQSQQVLLSHFNQNKENEFFQELLKSDMAANAFEHAATERNLPLVINLMNIGVPVCDMNAFNVDFMDNAIKKKDLATLMLFLDPSAVQIPDDKIRRHVRARGIKLLEEARGKANAAYLPNTSGISYPGHRKSKREYDDRQKIQTLKRRWPRFEVYCALASVPVNLETIYISDRDSDTEKKLEYALPSEIHRWCLSFLLGITTENPRGKNIEQETYDAVSTNTNLPQQLIVEIFMPAIETKYVTVPDEHLTHDVKAVHVDAYDFDGILGLANDARELLHVFESNINKPEFSVKSNPRWDGMISFFSPSSAYTATQKKIFNMFFDKFYQLVKAAQSGPKAPSENEVDEREEGEECKESDNNILHPLPSCEALKQRFPTFAAMAEIFAEKRYAEVKKILLAANAPKPIPINMPTTH